MFFIFLLFLIVPCVAICPCPGTECLNFTTVSSCFGTYYTRGIYNVRVKAHTTDGSNITVRTMPGDKTNPCSSTGTIYTDLSQTVPMECYESSTFLLNTCGTNGFSVVIKNENVVGDAPTNYIFTLTSAVECPTPSPTALPTLSPTTNVPITSPTHNPTLSSTYNPTISPTYNPTTLNPIASPDLNTDNSNVKPIILYTCAAFFLTLIFFACVCTILRKYKKRSSSYTHMGGDVKLRERRTSHSHSRSSSKRSSVKFSNSDVDGNFMFMLKNIPKDEEDAIIELRS